MNTTTTTEVRVDAYLEPPNLAAYNDYCKYLSDFDKFLDFLSSHANVASSQTKKRVKMPSVSHVEAVQRKLRPLLSIPEPESDSDDFSVVRASASAAPANPDPVGVPERVEALVKRPKAVADHVPPIGQPNPQATTAAATLLGKKQCKKRMAPFCTTALVERLVSTDWISRDPAVFPRMLDHLRRVSERAGCKLDLDDVKIRVLDQAPPRPGLVDYPDYKAIFDASDPGSDASI